MRTVIVYLARAARDDVVSFLDEALPTQSSPWVVLSGDDPVLYIRLDPTPLAGLEESEGAELVRCLGEPPTMALVVDVSGRHDGTPEVIAFVREVLRRFDGVATDEYTDHCWTRDELEAGRSVEGHPFFDSRGRHGGLR